MTAFEWNSFEPVILGLVQVNPLRRSRLLPLLHPLIKWEETTRMIPVFAKPPPQTGGERLLLLTPGQFPICAA